jgi:hypothetical protein
LKLWVMLAVLLASTPAFACPQCAMKEQAGLGSWFILAGMILFPFVVVGGALYVCRKMAILSVGENP